MQKVRSQKFLKYKIPEKSIFIPCVAVGIALVTTSPALRQSLSGREQHMHATK